MAALDKSSFEVKYNDSSTGYFKDNTTQNRIPSQDRSLVTDIKDSFLSIADNFIDEDNFNSDSATKVPSQQSVKAYVDSRISTTTVLSDVDRYSRYVTDFLEDLNSTNHSGPAGYKISQSNGSQVSGLTNTDANLNAVGTCSFGYNNNAGSFYSVWCGYVRLSKIAVKRRFRLRITNLSDATNRYTFYAGMRTQAALVSTPTEGVFFRYTDNVNSGKWEAVCVSDSIETAVDTTVSVATSDFSIFEINVNQAGTSVTFYIDDVLAATITTNIPIETGETVNCFFQVIRSAGAQTDMVSIDWDETVFTRSSARK